MEDSFQDRDGIFDNTINDYANTEDIIKLLNNADKRIKELEQDNLYLKEQNKSLIDEEEYISKKMQKVGFDNIEDLCNLQKQLAIEELEKVLPSIKATIELAESRYQMKDQVDIIFGNQIKSLKGEK